ncbi:hypothetical protein sphantq_03429 [Sphingobium sp. AntQ-1]|uniref:hypothetical protein n=1 Tax=Sphingobium sp. AntQ-1 TaxID=2930091 RepID=UPI000A712517|nr:hypothetical protein [Sphingobium sp. AntQ-1]WCP14975.1 hypothetical protein sphantq_03429 [Sphingobium sp. AntQ-1]
MATAILPMRPIVITKRVPLGPSVLDSIGVRKRSYNRLFAWRLRAMRLAVRHGTGYQPEYRR